MPKNIDNESNTKPSGHKRKITMFDRDAASHELDFEELRLKINAKENQDNDH